MGQEQPDPELFRRLDKLLKVYIAEIGTALGLKGDNHRLLMIGYGLAFEGHKYTPNRESGEPYIMHPFRQFRRISIRMLKFGVVSLDFIRLTLLIILLHDTVEDALKGKILPFVAYSKICTLLDELTAYCVLTLTKKKFETKEDETRKEFLERVLRSELWMVFVAKPEDMIDNLTTLNALPFEKQPGKVREAVTYGPKIKVRAVRLITMAGKNNYLPDWKSWLNLVDDQHRELQAVAKIEKKRLVSMGYRFN